MKLALIIHAKPLVHMFLSYYLTSNRGGRATNHFGGLDVAPGRHCRVQWTWCHCWVPLQAGRMWCHCRVPLSLWLGRVTTNFGGVDVVPLQGAIIVCYGGGRGGMWCHCRVAL